MMSREEVIRWLESLEYGSSVGISEDGISLAEIDAEGNITDAYLEVGGIPEMPE